MTESPAALLRIAATELDHLNQAATAGPWRTVITDTEACDGIAVVCDSDSHPADELNWVHDCCPESGNGPALVKAADADLIVTLRPAAPLLAEVFRALADRYDHLGVGNAMSAWLQAAGEAMIHGFREATTLARVILGETEPQPPTLAQRHQQHYQSCICLGESAECCVADCSCHDETDSGGLR